MIQSPIPTYQEETLCQTLFSYITVAKNLQTQTETIMKSSKNCQTNSLSLELQILMKMQQFEGFPNVISHTVNTFNQITHIECQKLGSSIKTLITNSNKCSVQIPIQSIVRLSFQMLERVQLLHQNGYLHLDLKPQHFLFQNDSDPFSTLYLIDFGMAQRITENQDCENASITKNGKFRGNMAYASVNSMKCKKQSIKDDLQSLLYILAELIEGQLPWKPKNHAQGPQKCWKSYYSRSLSKKLHRTGWKKYGNWVNQTLNKIRSSDNPYNQLRRNICKLLEIQIE